MVEGALLEEVLKLSAVVVDSSAASTLKVAGDGVELREETEVDSCELFSLADVRAMFAAPAGLEVGSVRVVVVVTVTVVTDAGASEVANADSESLSGSNDIN